MMTQKEVGEVMQEQTDQDYGRYEGNQTSFARQHYKASYEQDVKEEPSGKVYPLSRDNTNILRFAMAVIALGLILLFGLLFVIGIGGTVGWASFAVACFALFAIAGLGIISLRPRG